MDAVKTLFLCLAYVTGTAADTCYGAYSNLYCMFGCCSDTFLIYCCLSNGAGIGIIIAAIVVILAIIGICLRRHRHHRAAHHCPPPACSPAQRTVVVENSNTGFANAAYGKPPPYC